METVVPKLVEHKAEPAAKDWSGVAPDMGCSRKDKAMGMVTPVKATKSDVTKLALMAAEDVERPPEVGQQII